MALIPKEEVKDTICSGTDVYQIIGSYGSDELGEVSVTGTLFRGATSKLLKDDQGNLSNYYSPSGMVFEKSIDEISFIDGFTNADSIYYHFLYSTNLEEDINNAE